MRIQRNQRSAGLCQMGSCCNTSSAAHGSSKATSFRIARPSATSMKGHHYRPTQPQASAISLAGNGQRVHRLSRQGARRSRLPRRISRRCSKVICRRRPLMRRSYVCSLRAFALACSTRPTGCRTRRSRRAGSTARSIAISRVGMANESMVLLKNDGVLPLKSVRHMLVAGPLADRRDVLLGNYNGTPTHTVSVLEGMKRSFPRSRSATFQGHSSCPIAAIGCRLPYFRLLTEVRASGEARLGLRSRIALRSHHHAR